MTPGRTEEEMNRPLKLAFENYVTGKWKISCQALEYVGFNEKLWDSIMKGRSQSSKRKATQAEAGPSTSAHKRVKN